MEIMVMLDHESKNTWILKQTRNQPNMKKSTPNQQRKAAKKVAKKVSDLVIKEMRAHSAAAPAARPRQAVRSPNGAQPRYNDGETRYDSGARYVTDDPVPTPIPGKAKVKLELKSRNDANLIGFGHSHDDAIDANPKFPTPQPTALVFDAALAAYEAKVAEMDIHHEAGKALTNDRDLLRATFESLFTQRGSYVEMTSQGDASWIMSAALPVKSGPTPTGILPPPVGLSVDLNGVEGEMTIHWQPVMGAKTYMLEIAEVVNNVAVGWSLLYMGGKFSTRKTGMTVGKIHAFRVAAVGGEGGMSAFSPEVFRAAA